MQDSFAPAPRSGAPTNEDRRAALASMGQYVAYTAPALLALLIGTKAHAAS
jgi:hypothetical protein